MTWDQGLAKFFNKGDKEFNRLYESASEWRLKAVTFATFCDRPRASDALRKCFIALQMAAARAKQQPPKDLDFEEFWNEFSSGGSQKKTQSTESKRSRKKAVPFSENGSVTVPLQRIEEDLL